MQQCVKLEIKKDSPCRSRSPDGAKFGHFTFVLQRTAKKCTKYYNARALPLFY